MVVTVRVQGSVVGAVGSFLSEHTLLYFLSVLNSATNTKHKIIIMNKYHGMENTEGMKTIHINIKMSM